MHQWVSEWVSEWVSVCVCVCVCVNWIQLDREIVTNWACKILLSQTALTSQVHSNWYQNVQFVRIYYHTMPERNWSGNGWIQANIKVFFFPLINKVRVLSLTRWLDKTKWRWGSSDQEVSTVQIRLASQINMDCLHSFIYYSSYLIYPVVWLTVGAPL